MVRTAAFSAISRIPVTARSGITTSRARSVAARAEMDEWTKNDNRRMLHAVYRVSDMDATIKYYKDHFGMEQLRYRDMPEEKFTNAFMGFGPEDKNFAVELTYNYGQTEYNIGNGFGHFAVATTDVYKMADSIKSAGGKITRDAGPVKGGTRNIAFCEDPTGYKFELIEREKLGKEQFAQVMLRVTDLDKSIEYYEKCLGMQCLRRKDNEEGKYTLAFMSYGPEEDNCVFELTYNWGQHEPYDLGDAYAQVAIGTDDVYKTAESVRNAGGQVTKEPQEIASIGTKIMATTDPDGWKVVFVDNQDFLRELE